MQVWTVGAVNSLALLFFQQTLLVVLFYALHRASGLVITVCLPPKSAPTLAPGHMMESKGPKHQFPQSLMSPSPAFWEVKCYHQVQRKYWNTPLLTRHMVLGITVPSLLCVAIWLRFGQLNVGGSVVCHFQEVSLKGKGTLSLSFFFLLKGM